MFILDNMESELNVINTIMKRMYPFIVNVDGVERNNYRQHSINRRVNKTMIDIYVSPTHFCELMDDKVHVKLSNRMLNECHQLLRSVYPKLQIEHTTFRFFPDVDKVTIFDDLD